MIDVLLSHKFRNAALQAYPQLASESNLPFEIAQSTQDKFGHYQFNSAMKFAKLLGLSPREIATHIVENVEKGPEIAELSIAGPGFINITLSADYLSAYVQKIISDDRLGIPMPERREKIVIDFSSPNTAKEMHVGHLRSTIIGDCLANLFEFLGNDVLRLNHVGDWGTAFGMLIAYMKNRVPQALDGSMQMSLTDLVSWYKASKALFDADNDFKKQSQMEVVALQGGNRDSLNAWTQICEVSRKAYQEIYDLLNVRLIERGESYYNPVLPEVVADLESKGLVQLSDGAKCIFVDGYENREGKAMPLMIQKSDGGYNYDTTDMATIRQRIDVEHADRIIIVTDAGQSLHFALIFRVAEMAGYLDRSKVRVDHVPFGLVLGSDGKKFKTRSGDTEKLIDLLTAAIDKADSILQTRSPEMPEDARKQLAKTLGLAAIKYADLSSHRVSDYVFSYDKMLRFEGNTAAYLMYSYVRVAGIKRKVNIDIDQLKADCKIDLKHPSEVALGMHLAQFAETLQSLSNDLLPHHLTDYLYVLAEKFNAFFRDCRVEGSPEETSRLLLCEAVARTMQKGLAILGIQVVDRM